MMALSRFFVSGSTNLLNMALPTEEPAAAEARPRFLRANHDARLAFFSLGAVDESVPSPGSRFEGDAPRPAVVDEELLDDAPTSSAESSDR